MSQDMANSMTVKKIEDQTDMPGPFIAVKFLMGCVYATVAITLPV